jgi:predicted AAA+ superfamily ATPase
MGIYAEKLVAHEVNKWPEAIETFYYRKKQQEVAFVVTQVGNRYLPMEVKYRKSSDNATGLKHFMKKFGLDFGVVITRERECRFDKGIFYLPL